jgi:hypothetical protein
MREDVFAMNEGIYRIVLPGPFRIIAVIEALSRRAIAALEGISGHPVCRISGLARSFRCRILQGRASVQT